MALNLDTIIEDDSKLNDGVWIDFPEADGVELLIASANGTAYRDAMQKAVKKLPKNRKAWTENKLLSVQLPLIAAHILLDWKGIEITDEKTGKAKAVKYSTEVGLEYLKKVRILRDFVVGQMTEAENYLLEHREQAAKN